MRASTFHSAALALLRRFEGDPGRILRPKAILLRRIGNGLPGRIASGPQAISRPRSSGRRTGASRPRRTATGSATHEPPIPADLMLRVFREYERRKAAEGMLDFEDLLGRTVRLLEERRRRAGGACASTGARSRSTSTRTSTCCSRRCSTSGSASATSSARSATTTSRSTASRARARGGCSRLPRRFPNAHVVQLERELPLDAAGARAREPPRAAARRLGEDAARDARAGRGAGRRPGSRPWLARVRQLHAGGLPLEEMAVLVRTNARTTEFEEAFHDAAIPFQGASLLARDAARQLLKALRGRRGPAGESVRAAGGSAGAAWPRLPEKLGEREQTRQADLARLVRLAEEFERRGRRSSSSRCTSASARARAAASIS